MAAHLSKLEKNILLWIHKNIPRDTEECFTRGVFWGIAITIFGFAIDYFYSNNIFLVTIGVVFINLFFSIVMHDAQQHNELKKNIPYAGITVYERLAKFFLGIILIIAMGAIITGYFF